MLRVWVDRQPIAPFIFHVIWKYPHQIWILCGFIDWEHSNCASTYCAFILRKYIGRPEAGPGNRDDGLEIILLLHIDDVVYVPNDVPIPQIIDFVYRTTLREISVGGKQPQAKVS